MRRQGESRGSGAGHRWVRSEGWGQGVRGQGRVGKELQMGPMGCMGAGAGDEFRVGPGMTVDPGKGG